MFITVRAESNLYDPPKPMKISPEFQFRLARKGPGDMVKVWVFFTDKGVLTQDEYSRALKDAERALTERARRRRLKARAGRGIVSYCDLPVRREYVEEIASLGARVEVVSRWLNGVTVRAPVRVIFGLERLPFVREIRRVVTHRERGEPTLPSHIRSTAPPSKAPLYFDYGFSWTQDSLLNIPQAHLLGYSGAGVLICILDTGFDFDRTGTGTGHESLLHIREHLVAEWDFVSNDSMTGYDPENDSIDQIYGPAQTRHGTWMLSLVAGYKNGKLIGPAFGASLALARTELADPNIIAEEDWWIAGMEWADSLGADIISSSLGFKDFADAADYGYSDMDGKTFPVSVAADSATKLGILVVNAMGDVMASWQTTRPDTCIKAPADADSIIAVGGVSNEGAWTFSDTTSGSAIGPPYDQRDTLTGEPLPRDLRTRWKPDLMGPWEHVFCHPDSDTGYLAGFGTGGATALVAGACALVMEARPSWTNIEVREILLQTASNCSLPNDTLGWGIPDVVRAMGYGDTSPPPAPIDLTADGANPSPWSDDPLFLINWTNPPDASGIAKSLYKLGEPPTANYDTTGAMAGMPPDSVAATAEGGQMLYLWLVDGAGNVNYQNHASVELRWTGLVPPDSTPPTGSYLSSKNVYAYPNPFDPDNEITVLRFSLAKTAQVTIRLFDTGGNPVTTLMDGEEFEAKEEQAVVWKGENDRGDIVANGIYFFVISTDRAERAVGKVGVLR